MLNLRRFEHFLVLAEEGSFARASRKLHLTQPALTRSIQTLEEALDLLLFDRNRDGVTLTSAGATMRVRAHRLLAEANDIKREAERLRGVEVGQVSFGVGVFPSSLFLSEVLTQQVALRPQLLVKVEIESWVRLLERLQRDELDFAVAMTRSLPPPAGYRVVQLPTQHLGYFVRSGHPLHGKRAKETRAGIGRYPLVSPQLPTKAMENMAKLFGLAANQEVPGLRCDNAEILKKIALQTDAVLFSTSENLREEISRGELHGLPLLSEDESSLHLSLIYTESRSLSLAAQWMASLIQTHFEANMRER